MSGKHLYAEFEAEPGQGGAVASLVAGYGRDVSGEPGNVRFDAYRLRDARDRFFVYEQYADDDAFATHLATAHCTTFNEAIAPLVIGGGSALTWLEPIEP